MKQIIIGKNEADQKLIKLLGKYLNEAPAGFLYKMLRKKNIILNGKKADGTELLKDADQITLYLSDDTIEKFMKQTGAMVEHHLSILYEDEHVLIINKEAGVLSQKAGPDDISLVDQIISYLIDQKEITKENLKSFRPGLCNRLDRNTSGIIAAGKSLAGLKAMGDLFKSREIDKYYLTIVKGKIEEKQRIEGFLYKEKSHNKVIITNQPAKDSVPIKTEYEPLKTNGSYTMIRVKLITGKSHQIRAHLKSIGHPIVGDGKYGDVMVNRYFKTKYQLKHHLLHSAELRFPEMRGVLGHLSGKVITAPLPDYFEQMKGNEFSQ